MIALTFAFISFVFFARVYTVFFPTNSISWIKLSRSKPSYQVLIPFCSNNGLRAFFDPNLAFRFKVFV